MRLLNYNKKDRNIVKKEVLNLEANTSADTYYFRL